MPSLLATSTAVLLTATATSIYLLHTSLKSRVHHESHRSSGTRLPPATTAAIMTLPPAALTTSYRIMHDSATQRIPRSQLSNIPLPDQFTLLVRRNMCAFARFPQAWILWLTSPAAQRQTFTQSHIQALDFNEGDVVCAVYPVLRRSENAVEMGIRSPRLPSVEGRLVIRWEEKGDDVVFCSEAAMWTGVDENAVMPLEVPFVRFMHEMASWWLLDSGVRYLVGLGRSG
ncbi:hypothetical protein P168DRAFT_286541 [Aspergillus campestris IBT 28561]|uniref:Uncharacterized protein n=1 Tax=Aspergillus campestris (strain IBT 28561) TaxID=1392248 RepID=A0A2I1DEV8_ASPC2|nr:uncharacterized protein P168DRAFT_286541 [Aspergillus campestris IBT 28561]PKY08419.1 hypothetical protein P168DRAFT_286541 [Aspergillus campestris IBT 28561]